MKEDTIEGLKLGADDYVTKPFSMEELILRMENIFKRLPKTEASTQNQFKIGRFEFDNTVRAAPIVGELGNNCRAEFVRDSVDVLGHRITPPSVRVESSVPSNRGRSRIRSPLAALPHPSSKGIL